MFNQTFEPRDLFLVLVLVLLEGLLSIDNALVLGLLARRLPEKLQSKALSYGLIGSFVFRLIAIAAAAWLLKWRFVKLIGGGYLLYIAAKHLVFQGNTEKRNPADRTDGTTELTSSQERRALWAVVGAIELTDIAFAADSILAGIALVGVVPANTPHAIHPKLWVILIGGMLGVVMMRFAAAGFIHILKRFPRFETSAYLLVALVGLKLIADWWFNADSERLNFQSPSAWPFWLFWSLMGLCVGFGFLPLRADTTDDIRR